MYIDPRPKQQSPASHYSTQRAEHAHPGKRQKRRPGNSQAMNGEQVRGHVDAQNLSGFNNIESSQDDQVNNYRGCWRPFRDRWKPLLATEAQSYQPQNHASESAAAYQYLARDQQQQLQCDYEVSMDDGDQTHSSFPPYQPSLDSSNVVPDQQAHRQYTALSGLGTGDVHQGSSLYDVNTGIHNSHWSPFPGQLNASNPYAPPFQQQLHSQQQQQQQQQLHQPSVPYGAGYNTFGGPTLGHVPLGFDPVALTSTAASMSVSGQQSEMNLQQVEVLAPTRYVPPHVRAGGNASRASPVSNDGRRAAPQQPKAPRPLAVPVPTKEYMEQASRPPRRLASAQPLLIILDLNGTLIYRRHRRLPPSFAKRPGLDAFLTSIFAKHKVMIWTSSQPVTLKAVCAQLFPSWMRSALVAEWGRDKFGLTQSQYKEKIQVYKILNKVWGDKNIQAKYPKGVPIILKGDGNNPDVPIHKTRWDQTNTVLVDDSKLKAAGQPYNILEIPEFTSDPHVDETHTLDIVLRKLEILAQYEDVSQMFQHWETRRQQGDSESMSVENYIIEQEESAQINNVADNVSDVSDVSDGPDADNDAPAALVDGLPTEKDQRKKARKEERKAAASLRKRERKAAAKAAKKAEEQSAEQPAEQQAKQKPAKKKNKKKKKNAKGTNNNINNNNPIPVVDALCDGAASPAPSSSSENFLLDRLEESLTVSPTKVGDSQR
ncbi:NIF domain protein [Paecilomyces variotii No. 5]|uniref:NIF domain protein n=1 Tax=Byssochlamys spectabilis (strain No. 5 / NBRC 109023) TaxID=1356009 RepID=V5FID9_BYSSN|nr:NIF domain protein [Paecilomyces variotii No. 5]